MDVEALINDTSVTSNVGKLVKYEIHTATPEGVFEILGTRVLKGVGIFEGIHQKDVTENDRTLSRIYFKFSHLNAGIKIGVNSLALFSVTPVEV